MNSPKGLLGPMRVAFLVLPPVCVLLGVGTAAWSGGPVNLVHVALVLVGALAAHISVNALNEYFDFKSGLDLRTVRTPFSGGSGTLPADPAMARSALNTGLIALAITGVIGLYFSTVRGWALLPLGLLGLLVIVAYTPWLTRYAFLCLITPGLGFGPLMVMGTDFVLTGSYSWAAFFASLVPFFLVNDLLLLNQFPDVEADRSAGRRHLLIVAGNRASSVVYVLFLFLAFLSIAAGVWLGHLPVPGLLGLLALVIAVPTAVGAIRHAENLEKLMPYLGLNVLLNVITPLLLAIGLLVAA
jgi:1,4-dihydroxy-2-naphthoate polyprenyltransferase